MINKPPPFKGLDISIPIIIPVKGRGFINHGSTLGFRVRIRYHGLHEASTGRLCNSISRGVNSN